MAVESLIATAEGGGNFPYYVWPNVYDLLGGTKVIYFSIACISLIIQN